MVTPSSQYSIEFITGKRFFLVLFIAVLTTFSLAVSPGYESFSADQTIFLPPMLHSIDPSLFPNGDLEHARIISSKRSLVNDLLAFFVLRGANLLWLLFILSVLLRALFFAALYSIILYFTEDRLRAMFILLFFLAPFFVPGIGLATADSTFSYRTLALTSGLTYLALHLRGWRITSLAPLVFTFVIHPLTGFPFFFFHYLYATWETWNNRTNRSAILHNITALSIPILAALLFLWQQRSGATESFFLKIDDEWKQLANPRYQEAFFAFWGAQAYISVAGWMFFVSMLLLSLKTFIRNTQRQIVLSMLLLIPFGMLILAAVAEYSAIHGFIKIQLQRGLFLTSLFMPILVGMYTLWRGENHRTDIATNSFLFAILIWFLFKDTFLFLREQMLLFVPPLFILFYGSFIPYLKDGKRILISLAIITFVVLDGLTIARALFYKDIYPLVSFHLTLLGGVVVAWLYKKEILSSRTLALGCVSVAVPFLLITSAFHLKTFTIYPRFFYNAAYMEACAWVQQHTEKDSVFIVEPFTTDPPPEEFRLACFRPIFTTYKEGGVVPYDENREVGFEWKRKYDVLYAIRDNLALVEEVKQSYKLDYIFSETEIILPEQYPLVYSNNAYYIYDVHK